MCMTYASVFFFFSQGVDILVEPLRATLQTKVKANSVKQEFEKQDELKRSALRAVAALLSIPDSGKFSKLQKYSKLIGWEEVLCLKNVYIDIDFM